MGIFLLFLLSFIFGWAFTESKNRTIEKLSSQLEEKDKELARIVEQHEFEKRVWKATMKEYMDG